MAGVTPAKSNRHARRAAAATAPVDAGAAAIAPAVEASAKRAAIERDPAAPAVVPVVDAPVVPAASIPATDATVVPEPTLVATPDAPQPIVTASPILAVEPSALDVVQADAAADRVAAGLEPAGAPDGPHLAAAGQPTLTIEGSSADAVAHAIAEGVLDGISDTARDFVGASGSGKGWLDRDPLDDLLDDLRFAMRSDPVACARVLDELLPHATATASASPAVVPAKGMITVIEVIGPPAGRRRAGLSFGSTPRRFLSGALTHAELAALRADPLLTVGISEVAEADAFASTY